MRTNDLHGKNIRTSFWAPPKNFWLFSHAYYSSSSWPDKIVDKVSEGESKLIEGNNSYNVSPNLVSLDSHAILAGL